MNAWQSERQNLRRELESVTNELNAALLTSQKEITELKQTHDKQTRELESSTAQVQLLMQKCSGLENVLKHSRSESRIAVPALSPSPSNSVSGTKLSAVKWSYNEIFNLKKQ